MAEGGLQSRGYSKAALRPTLDDPGRHVLADTQKFVGRAEGLVCSGSSWSLGGYTPWMISWRERLEFRVNEAMLRRGLQLADAKVQLPKGVLAWGAHPTVKALSVLVNASDARDPRRLRKALEAAFTLECTVVFVTPNCYEDVVRLAIKAGAALQAIGAPEAGFRKPVVDVVQCAKFRKGDVVWIIDTNTAGNTRGMEVAAADVADDVIYTLKSDDLTRDAVPEDDVYASDAAAFSAAQRFDRVLARAIRDGTSLGDVENREE